MPRHTPHQLGHRHNHLVRRQMHLAQQVAAGPQLLRRRSDYIQIQIAADDYQICRAQITRKSVVHIMLDPVDAGVVITGCCPRPLQRLGRHIDSELAFK